jgi:hypothetical protein
MRRRDQPKAPVQFSAAQWQSIRQALSGAQRERVWPLEQPTVRRSLEQIADDLCRVGRSAGLREHTRPPSRQEKARYGAVAKKARTLANEIGTLPRLADAAWVTDLKQDLTKLSQAAARWAKARSRHPHNVDTARNVAWAQAATIYQEVTGRPVAVSERSNRDASGPPDGPFVRFIRAFMAATPCEPKPTGDELRGWFRAHWKRSQPRRIAQ